MKKILTAIVLTAVFTAAVFAEGKKEAGGSMMADSGAAQKNFFDLSGLGPSVLPYTGEKAAQAFAAKSTTVYFFAATWCPTCKGTYRDVVANSAALPEDFKLLFVNYDTEKDLKAKYGVTYQHTFVEIDAAGKAVKIWSGSATVTEIVKTARE